jgi:hypothetical protein
VAGSCEHGDEPSGFIKDGEFLDWLSDYISFPRKTLLHGIKCFVIVWVVILLR